MGAMGFAAVKATCPGAGAAGAAAYASGDIGAMGFAAVKATGPGAGAAGCLEAPHPIFVGGGRREDARCVGIPAGREHSGRAKVMRRKTRTELAKPGHRNQADVLVGPPCWLPVFYTKLQVALPSRACQGAQEL